MGIKYAVELRNAGYDQANLTVRFKMQSKDYRSILRNAESVLIVIGICDIALVITSLAMATSYTSIGKGSLEVLI